MPLCNENTIPICFNQTLVYLDRINLFLLHFQTMNHKSHLSLWQHMNPANNDVNYLMTVQVFFFFVINLDTIIICFSKELFLLKQDPIIFLIILLHFPLYP